MYLVVNPPIDTYRIPIISAKFRWTVRKYYHAHPLCDNFAPIDSDHLQEQSDELEALQVPSLLFEQRIVCIDL